MSAVSTGTGAGGVGTNTMTLTVADGGGLGNGSASFTLTNANSPGFRETIALASGDNVINFPALSGQYAIVLPNPLPNGAVVKSKASTGDAGEVVVGWKAGGLCYSPGAPPASMILNLSGVSSLAGVEVFCG
ncbi:MAG: hypothetical protein ACYCW6_00280 [Candidatus Xenobia bacterium]